MSTATVQRLYDETSERLAAVTTADEVRGIGLDFATKYGADVAEMVFVRLRELSPLSDPETNSMILQGLGHLVQAVVETFEAVGANDPAEIEAFGSRAQDGYLDRLEMLLSTPETRGRA